jgi:hypothetical protein
MNAQGLTKLKKKTLTSSIKATVRYLESVVEALDAQDDTNSFSHLDRRRLLQCHLADVMDDSVAYDQAVQAQLEGGGK